MKKWAILCSLLFFLVPFPVFSMDWQHTNTVKVAWDPVTAYLDGTPLPAGTVINYTLHTKEFKLGTIVDLPGLIATTTGSVTFQIEGRYYLGVKAVRLDGADIVSESTIAWSDMAEYCKDGKTFGVMYFRPHSPPKNEALTP